MRPHRVVIVGGGFGGLYAARALRRAPVDVTLIDRRNFHLFQPLLYQVATGALSPANIAAPLRAILKRSKSTRVLMGEVTDIDLERGAVQLAEAAVPFDSLIAATGSRHHYFGNDGWAPLAPGLKTVEDATEIRRRVLTAFEEAERSRDDCERERLMTFVVVGAGPTGVELAGALAEISRRTLRRNFRSIDPASATIVLVEGDARVLPTFPDVLSSKAAKALRELGVTVRTGVKVTAVERGRVQLQSDGGEETLHARTVLWGAGVQASPLGRVLANGAGIEPDRGGRVPVEPDCSLRGHPNIFVLGDLARYAGPDGEPLPGLAPVAMQQGTYVARLIRSRVTGKRPPRPFRYRDRGTMATIGRARAVADLFGLRFNGWVAWLAWLFVHLMYLVQFQNRVLVLVQWAWNYTTRNRSARLITGAGGTAERNRDTRRDAVVPDSAD